MSIKCASNLPRVSSSDSASVSSSDSASVSSSDSASDNARDSSDKYSEDDSSEGDDSYGEYPDNDAAAHDAGLPWHPILGYKERTDMLFHVRGTYAKWGPREAYRELVQNWYEHSTIPVSDLFHLHSLYHHILSSLHRRDAIIESNELDPRNFCVTLQATPPRRRGKTEIVYKAFGGHPDSGAGCLGFIRYIGENGVGTIELSNLRATLYPTHLDFGGTTKTERQDQAGAHGEGLKLAAMVLMQSSHNHSVFACSGGVNYTFNFNMIGKFVARLRRNDRTEPHPQFKKLSISTPPVMPTGDVYFIIGEKKGGRNERGLDVPKRRQVQQADFQSWSEVSLDLIKAEIGDQSIIWTPHGDVLISPDFCGKLYLKGLLLRESTETCSASMTGLPLIFGYNFAYGKTNRERQSVANAYEEASSYGRILCHALKDKPDLAGRVCDHLNSTEPQYAEAQCATIFWSKDAARKFKQHLLRGGFVDRWFYCRQEQVENPNLRQIVRSMGRQPFELTDRLWGILVQYDLVRTAEREGRRRYQNALTMQVPSTGFATSMHRLLRACFRACPQTSTMRVEFADAGEICLDIYVSTAEPLTRVHHRWLCIESAIAELGLVGDVSEAETVALTVKRLFGDVLNRLPREAFCQQENSRLPESLLKQEYHRAEQRLAKYQLIEARIIDEGNSESSNYAVKWVVNTSRQDDESKLEIHFHQVSTCAAFRDDYFIAADVDLDKRHCPSYDEDIDPGSQDQAATDNPDTGKHPCQILRNVRQKDSGYISGMEAGKEYFFAVVMPEDPNSFVKISNTIHVAARPSYRPNASIEAVNGNSMAAQSHARPNVSLTSSPSPSPALEPHNELQPYHDDIEEHEVIEVESAYDESMSRSGPESEAFLNGVGPLDRKHDRVGESRIIPRLPNQRGDNIELDSFSLGPRLDPNAVELLELAIEKLSWHKAENSDGVQAWIGISKRGNSFPEGSRKRPRMD